MSTTQPTPAHLDPGASVEERVADLLAQMSQEEKLAQLGSAWSFSLVRDGVFSQERAAPILEQGLGHVTRIAGATSLPAAEVARVANDIQRHLVEHTRLGIPAIVHEEVCSGVMARQSTIFPQAIGVASTFDPSLNERLADVVRQQLRAAGGHQGLSPVLDVTRDPRWGRTEEAYGEDPHLTAQMGVAFVRGLQGDSLRDGVIATAKHFVGHSASEGGMNWAPAHIPPRELREVYLHPFEAAVREAGLASVMNAYHELDGVPCGADQQLLTGLLRESWGFDGTVVSDYFAVDQLFSYHRLARDQQEAAALALTAGIDVELPGTDAYAGPLSAAIDAGQVPQEVVDTAVARILRQKIELGLLEDPYVDPDAVEAVIDTAEQCELALEIARRSLVLLKNDDARLPLEGTGTIAVIGPNADESRNLLGDYTYPAHIETLEWARERGDLLGGMPTIPADLQLDDTLEGIPTVLDELKARLGDRVRHTLGCGVTDPSMDGFEVAVRLAQDADVAVVVVGDRSGLTPDSTSGEGRDRASLDLPGVQEELVRAIADTGTPVVAVLVGGRPMGSERMHERCDAVLMAWLPGQAGARAIAEVLTGEVAPSGKLPISYPRSVGQLPVFYGHKLSGGRSHWHGDYVELPTSPRYPFGHGLGYTQMVVDSVALDRDEVAVGESAHVTARVTNAGERAGEEVVQLYVRDREASITRPVLELKAFTRVVLEPGQSRTVDFELPTGQLGFYDRDLDYVVEAGVIEVHVGTSVDRLEPALELTIVDGPTAGDRVDKVFSGRVSVGD